MYDQYYASLAASSAAASAQPTPTATGINSSSSGSPSFPTGAGEDEDEDKKPNIEYLDSLNAYRKRSRSQEDVGAASKVKVAKTDDTTVHMNGNGYLNIPGTNGTNGINGNGHSYGSHSQVDVIMQTQDSVVAAISAPADDPMIMGKGSVLIPRGLVSVNLPFSPVNGVPKPYSQVTEDDHDLMTPDEYAAYFEIYSTRGDD